MDQTVMTVFYPEPTDVNPYPTPVPVPYDPENPNLPDPVDAPPPPERIYQTPQEAIEYNTPHVEPL
jgi:hypothetical protein